MIKAQKANDAMLFALVEAHNIYQKSLTSSAVHYDVSASEAEPSSDYRTPGESVLAVGAANASDLATLITVTNEIKATYNDHGQDDHVHDVADTANVIAAADATDLATAMAVLNEAKADHNTHRSESGVHANNDAGNAIAAADATDQASAETLANELKTDVNAHIAAATASTVMIRLV